MLRRHSTDRIFHRTENSSNKPSPVGLRRSGHQILSPTVHRRFGRFVVLAGVVAGFSAATSRRGGPLGAKSQPRSAVKQLLVAARPIAGQLRPHVGQISPRTIITIFSNGSRPARSEMSFPGSFSQPICTYAQRSDLPQQPNPRAKTSGHVSFRAP